MNILALDLGSKTTGWAKLVDGKITTGVQKFKRGKNEPRGKTVFDFSDWLINFPIPHPVSIDDDIFSSSENDDGTSESEPEAVWDLIVYEQPHHVGGAATFFGVGLAATTESIAFLFNSPVMAEHTQTIKKFAAGSAKVTDGKSQTLARAQQWNPAITDDNEADALCLLLYVCTQKGIPIPPHGREG